MTGRNVSPNEFAIWARGSGRDALFLIAAGALFITAAAWFG